MPAAIRCALVFGVMLLQGCGGFPDVRAPSRDEKVTPPTTKSYTGYWVSSASTPFKVSQDDRDLSYVFEGDDSLVNVLAIQASGEVLLYGARKKDSGDFEIIEDLLGHLEVKENESGIRLDGTYLKNIPTKQNLVLRMDASGKILQVQVDGFYYAFDSTDPTQVLKVVKAPAF